MDKIKMQCVEIHTWAIKKCKEVIIMGITVVITMGIITAVIIMGISYFCGIWGDG